MTGPRRFPASKVTVRRLYEVFCEACNANPFSEFYDSKVEAEDARRGHIEAHNRPEEFDD